MEDTNKKLTKIIRVTNKKNGVTYLYEDHAFWNKEKKRGEHKRKCIGRLGPDGVAIYNEYYKARKQAARTETPLVSRTTLMGQNLILDKIIKDTSLKPVLREAFGADDAEAILQLARYSVCEGKALGRARDWLNDRGFNGDALCSQRISELLSSISDDRRNTFFKLWIARNAGKKALLFDITSISSYCRHNAYVERGYNRDHEKLPQINLALLSAHSSNVPFLYSQLPGRRSNAPRNNACRWQQFRRDSGYLVTIIWICG